MHRGMGLTYSNQRRNNDDLVDMLYTSNAVDSVQIERVMRLVDRARFLPSDLGNDQKPHEDRPIKVNLRRLNLDQDTSEPGVNLVHLSAPSMYCVALKKLELKTGQSFLNIGSGCGWLSTVVGLLLGDSGTNHGIEIHPELVGYAERRLAETLNMPEMTIFSFAKPKFFVGNGLAQLPKGELDKVLHYDRIYVGAALPDDKFLNRVVRLLEIGGKVVAPRVNQFICITRLSESKFVQEHITSCSFMDIVLPTLEDSRNVLPPLQRINSLQQLCRSVITEHLRQATHGDVSLYIKSRVERPNATKDYLDDFCLVAQTEPNYEHDNDDDRGDQSVPTRQQVRAQAYRAKDATRRRRLRQLSDSDDDGNRRRRRIDLQQRRRRSRNLNAETSSSSEHDDYDDYYDDDDDVVNTRIAHDYTLGRRQEPEPRSPSPTSPFPAEDVDEEEQESEEDMEGFETSGDAEDRGEQEQNGERESGGDTEDRGEQQEQSGEPEGGVEQQQQSQDLEAFQDVVRHPFIDINRMRRIIQQNRESRAEHEEQIAQDIEEMEREERRRRGRVSILASLRRPPAAPAPPRPPPRRNPMAIAAARQIEENRRLMALIQEQMRRAGAEDDEEEAEQPRRNNHPFLRIPLPRVRTPEEMMVDENESHGEEGESSSESEDEVEHIDIREAAAARGVEPMVIMLDEVVDQDHPPLGRWLDMIWGMDLPQVRLPAIPGSLREYNLPRREEDEEDETLAQRPPGRHDNDYEEIQQRRQFLLRERHPAPHRDRRDQTDSSDGSDDEEARVRVNMTVRLLRPSEQQIALERRQALNRDNRTPPEGVLIENNQRTGRGGYEGRMVGALSDDEDEFPRRRRVIDPEAELRRRRDQIREERQIQQNVLRQRERELAARRSRTRTIVTPNDTNVSLPKRCSDLPKSRTDLSLTNMKRVRYGDSPKITCEHVGSRGLTDRERRALLNKFSIMESTHQRRTIDDFGVIYHNRLNSLNLSQQAKNYLKYMWTPISELEFDMQINQ